MSDLWSYRPEKCDGDYCPMDCDKCYKADEAMEAKPGELPAVFHRKNDCPWLVTMKLEDWIEIYKEFINGN